MIDTIYAAFLIMFSLLWGAILVAAVKGDNMALWCVFVSACIMWADKVWAVRETSFVYSFLKGLLG